MRRRWWLVLGAAVLAAATATGLYGAVGHRPAAQPGPACRAVTATYRSALSAPIAPGAAGLIVVLGDSYSQGAGLPAGRAGAYPALIARASGRPVHLDGLSSTGYTTAGFCTGLPDTYGDRLGDDRLLALRPATVIVEGGVNDAHHGDPLGVRAAAAALLHRLAGVRQVLVVGPAHVTAADPEKLATVERALAADAKAAGRTYVDLYSRQIPLQADGIHPTESGQQQIARLLLPLIQQRRPPTSG